MNAAGIHVFGVRHRPPVRSMYWTFWMRSILRPCSSKGRRMQGEIRHLTQATTKPPVAILALPKNCPYERFCGLCGIFPEYQAMRWAQKHGAYAAFIDLPSSAAVCLQDLRRSSDDEARVKELEDEELGSDSVPAGPMDESRPDENPYMSGLPSLPANTITICTGSGATSII